MLISKPKDPRSPACENTKGCDAGVTFHPSGTSRRSVPSDVPLTLLRTSAVSFTVGEAAFCGATARAGLNEVAMAGTTVRGQTF